MSHITTIKTELKDGRILRSVLLKLGYHVKEGGEITGGYGGPRRTVDILATTNGQAIGFRRLFHNRTSEMSFMSYPTIRNSFCQERGMGYLRGQSVTILL